MGKLGFGELELSILQTVQKLGRTTVRDVYRSLGSPGSYTTIMTVMSRMADKGELTRKKEGKKYMYWIAEHNQARCKTILKRIQDKLFGGKSTAMVSYLLENDLEISDEELAQIEQMIQKRKLEQSDG